MERNGNEKLAAMKAELARKREKCAACEKWECGYCAHPKLELMAAIEKMEEEEARYMGVAV